MNRKTTREISPVNQLALCSRARDRARLARQLAAAVFFIGLCILCEATTAADDRYNVLFIVADDMNTELGCYGHEEVKTPSLDRLCSMGMRFDTAYCQAPLCNPSRVSFLSGLRPDRTGVYTLSEPTRRRLKHAVMLPQCFKQHGYYTVQSGKIFHTGEGFEDPASWDVLLPEFGKQPLGFRRIVSVRLQIGIPVRSR